MNCRQAHWQDNVIRIIIWIVWSIILNHIEANRTVPASSDSVSCESSVLSYLYCFQWCLGHSSFWMFPLLHLRHTHWPHLDTDYDIHSFLYCFVTDGPHRYWLWRALHAPRHTWQLWGIWGYNIWHVRLKTDLGAPRSVHKRHRPGCVGLFAD